MEFEIINLCVIFGMDLGGFWNGFGWLLEWVLIGINLIFEKGMF